MLRRYSLFFAAALFCFSTVPAVFGQGTQDSGAGSLVYIASNPVPCTTSAEPKELAALDNAYKKGDWTYIRSALNDLIKAVRSNCKLDNQDKDGVGVYLVSFLHNDQNAQPAIVRLAAPAADDKSYQPYNARLIPRTTSPHIYDIRIAKVTMGTAYNGTPLQNPLTSSLSKFVSTVVSGIGKSPLLPFPGETLQAFASRNAEGESVLTVNELTIPKEWRRFSLTVQDKPVPASAVAPKIDSLTTKYTLGPGTSWDLGLGAGVPVEMFGNKPVKVDSSKNLTSDPPTGLLTYAAVYWHFRPYDETAAVATVAEQNKLFVGIALTPDPGLVLGYAWSPAALRSISFHIGGGVLLANVLQKDDHIGSPPTISGHPTRRGALGVTFIGLGYSL